MSSEREGRLRGGKRERGEQWEREGEAEGERQQTDNWQTNAAHARCA